MRNELTNYAAALTWPWPGLVGVGSATVRGVCLGERGGWQWGAGGLQKYRWHSLCRGGAGRAPAGEDTNVPQCPADRTGKRSRSPPSNAAALRSLQRSPRVLYPWGGCCINRDAEPSLSKLPPSLHATGMCVHVPQPASLPANPPLSLPSTGTNVLITLTTQ